MKNRYLLGVAAAFVLAAGAYASPNDDTLTGTPQSRSQAGRLNEIGQETSALPALQRRNPRYQLTKGDTFALDFPFTPEFNQEEIVQPDGYITLLEVGDLHVEGKTVPELTESIRSAYAKILHDPVVTIKLKDFERPYFVAGGELAHPGKYDLRGDTTVAQAVAIAGGFTENSKHSQVWLFRRVSNDWVEVQKLNLKKMFAAANLAEDAHLRPGDMLFVPRNALSKVKRFLPTESLSLYFRPFF